MQSDLQKKFVKHIENLPQHLLEKFIGDNLSIIDIAQGSLKLSIIVIVLVQKSLLCPSLDTVKDQSCIPVPTGQGMLWNGMGNSMEWKKSFDMEYGRCSDWKGMEDLKNGMEDRLPY